MSCRVLIVDDSLTVRMDLCEAFELAGFACAPCATVIEAHEALMAGTFDLVVSDVRLPDGDGTDLLRHIKSTAALQSMPVMMLSSEAEVSDRIRGLKIGADEYVGKPYDRSYVVARGRELLRKQRGSETVQVLIIDDSATFREELRRLLEGAGYSVASAGSGEEGLRIAASLRPSTIIVDGQLPGMDGWSLIRQIRGDTLLRRTLCIMLTGSVARRRELEALEAGADSYLHKEEDPQIMLARLGALLRASVPTPAAPSPASLFGPKRVLAVDDSPAYLQTIAVQLRDDGYDVVSARSGEEALALLEVQPVDCIILDMVMSGISGEETCRVIKRTPAWRDIPLIMHTSLDERAAMIEGINAGADDYITKSEDLQVLRARLRAQLRRKQFEDENRSIREQLLQRELEAAGARAAREVAETRAKLFTELHEANRELMQAKADLEERNQRVHEASRLKSEFLANMSHELRTPLNGIIGFTQLIFYDQVRPEMPEFKEYVGDILASANHLLQLINDVLDLSKIEAGRLEFDPEPTTLAPLIHEAVSVQRPVAARGQVQVEVDLDGTIGTVVLDSARFRQVVYNYLSNAIKFTSPGGRVRVTTHAQGDGFRLAVTDTGIGIAPADLTRLFATFEQLESGAARKHTGTGLGLALTKRLVEAQGGSVGVTSVLGTGSTFFADLPRDTRPSTASRRRA